MVGGKGRDFFELGLSLRHGVEGGGWESRAGRRSLSFSAMFGCGGDVGLGEG